jgi:hypothetical protein
MKKIPLSFAKIAMLAAGLLLAAAQVHAQATRTWVSGVGDDVNPCSRTAPCKTFAGAISKTAAGGEIDALDPGGFGVVTITKAITIAGDGTLAGILAAGTNGVNVQAGPNDVVILRNLSINGAGTGVNGINFVTGGKLIVENVSLYGFTGQGILFQPSLASSLAVSDSLINNNAGGGIFVKPTATGTATGVVDRTTMEGNGRAVRVEDGSTVLVRSSVGSLSANSGFVAAGISRAAVLNLENSVASSNGLSGVQSSNAQATVRISNMMVTGNGTGLGASGGAIISFGNNRVHGNGTDGAPTATVGEI